MVARIVESWGVSAGGGAERGFPTARRLADVSLRDWKRLARVGYRAEFLHRLSRDVVDGRLDLDAIEHFDGPGDELHKRLKCIHGVGDYAAGNLCMLLGRYDRLAIDTEMMRHLKTQRPRVRWTPARIRRHYDAWRPYQFLAYWYELWQGYTQKHGAAQNWTPEQTGRRITT
jgi:3-methyladenine DNA glycosylase/8-oxoguanine DNA glycosylase